MYDYIIVGGGAAGCVLAHRLTEDDSIDVLLLESGTPQEDRDMVKDPTRVWDLLGSDVDWSFETEPQSGLNGRSIDWPRGKALGGSTVINGMAWVRGHPHDFDNWADQGNEGWSYDDLLPYFKRSEDFSGGGDEAYHGTDGPLSVSRGDDPGDLSETLVEAAADELDVGINMDFNGERQAGAGYYHSTIDDGHRHSTAAAFIKPILDRENLHVETAAHVTEVNFDADTATGVTYQQGWSFHDAEVVDGGEVLLTAGAIQTPQLLMLSGIGPADHLAEHDIDVKVDLPGVGRNMQDHLRVGVMFETTDPVETRGTDDKSTRYDRVSAGAFARSDPDLPAPDMQFGMGPGLGPDDPTGGYTVTVLPLRPEARGRLTLQSDDPWDHPKIDPKYLETETDVDDFVECVRWARRIGESEHLDDVREAEVAPGPDAQSDEELAEYVRNTAVSGYHPSCTAKMGDDDMAVVDDHLRVHGLNNLRVVDTSVMPQITSGNTNAPTIAIAEKGADLVKDAR